MNKFLLETDRLVLTPFAPTDVEALHQLRMTPVVRKFLWDDQIIPHETVVEIVEASIQSFADQNFGFWTLRLKDQPSLIGFSGLRHMEHSPDEIAEVEIFMGFSQGIGSKDWQPKLRKLCLITDLRRLDWNIFTLERIRRTRRHFR